MENNHKKDETKTSESKDSVSQNKLSIPVAIIIAGIFIAGALYLGTLNSVHIPTTTSINNPAQQPIQQPIKQPARQAVDIAKVKTEGEPFIGNPNAQVTVAYWSDYQCPFCKRFEENTISQLIKDYVKTGKVKVVFKDFQFLGPDSQIAGLAEHAVWEVAPEKFYEWHKAMYDKQDSENSGWGSKADILALTKGLGINSVKVGQLMISKAIEYKKEMNADKVEGGTFGINGTPGTIIGKNLISGAQPYSVVKQFIDLALRGK